MGAPDLSEEAVAAFLAARYGRPVAEFERLSGGYWSAAFGFRVGDRDLVARFGGIDYDADLAAMAYAGPDLPVPPVHETGEAFGGYYAVSERRYGRFLETVGPAEAHAAGPALARLLGGLKAVPPPSGEGTPDAWRASVRNALVDDPRRTVSGWRTTIAADPGLDRLFRACEDRVRLLSEALPERRDLVHGDLLHANVLVSDAVEVTAVFSWKCSERGDFLYDVAWCTFWAPFHPGIAAVDVWPQVLRADWARAEPGALVDAAARHHCYELAIGASHLGWYVYTGDDALLREVAATTAEVLERGPLPDGG